MVLLLKQTQIFSGQNNEKGLFSDIFRTGNNQIWPYFEVQLVSKRVQMWHKTVLLIYFLAYLFGPFTGVLHNTKHWTTFSFLFIKDDP